MKENEITVSENNIVKVSTPNGGSVSSGSVTSMLLYEILQLLKRITKESSNE